MKQVQNLLTTSLFVYYYKSLALKTKAKSQFIESLRSHDLSCMEKLIVNNKIIKDFYSIF